MVEQMAAPHKTRVPIDIIDPRAGIYAALSSDGARWYTVNVATKTCGCRAGRDGFRHCHKGACRHLIAARVVARGLASMTPDARMVALTLQNIRVLVEGVDVTTLDAPLGRPTVAASRPTTSAAGLLDAFGA